MSDAVERLGRMIKPPPAQIGVTTGIVTSISPLEVRVGESIIAKSPQLFYAAGLIFDVGDDVIVIASANNQKFYVVGRSARA